MLTGPLEPFSRPFPVTPGVETRATVPMQLLPWPGIVRTAAQDEHPILVEVAVNFPDGITGVCPVCREATSSVVSVGVQLFAASVAQPYRGPVDVVLEGHRPRSYRLEPCGCRMEVR